MASETLLLVVVVYQLAVVSSHALPERQVLSSSPNPTMPTESILATFAVEENLKVGDSGEAAPKRP